MVTVIRLLDVTDGASTADQGSAVLSAVRDALSNDCCVKISFSGVHVATSSFVNACFIPLLKMLSYDGLKKRIAVVDSNYQINDVIRRRISWELNQVFAAA